MAISSTETANARRHTEHSWILVRSVRELWHGFRAEQRALPEDVRHRFWLRMGIGLLLTVAVTVGITYLGEWAAPRGLDGWDERTLRWLVEEKLIFTYYDATIFESPGNLAMTVPLLLIVMIIAVRRGASLIAMSYFVGYLVTRPIIYLGWWIWNRSRPDFVAAGAASPPLHSYPSGHAVISMFMYGFLVWLWWRVSDSALERAFALFLGALFIAVIGWARLRLGTHWPSDIIAGFVIGAVWLAGVIWAVRAGEKPKNMNV
ncbi:MAG: phosphatase PAP2 family protein [Thermodesulfobacteriota bacterium]